MSGLFRFFNGMLVSFIACATVCAANAATSRNGVDGMRAASNGTSVARMPSMPTKQLTIVGNLRPGGNTPVVPDEPDKPDVPDEPEVPDEPDVPDEPTPECPDGGVKNSGYTIDMCMSDLFLCLNTGALPNGMHDMFNEDLRNSVINGLNVCTRQVDKCVSEVRRDCKNIYRGASDVWIDFNSRKVQPEYYNFVLRKTGLTPYQAEKTCLLLDKNTYGPSFSAVESSGNVTDEYNNTIGAYNGQMNNSLDKNNPLGPTLNDGNPGVDGQRGHYARWDAITATCHLRVAAYNKDKHISNSWLFGAIGDDKPAEVWRAAGETFTCDKDLFGFSLMKDTSTVALVGVGGGALLGAGVGAVAGHGDRLFDCENEKHIKELSSQLRTGNNIDVLNGMLDRSVQLSHLNERITPNQCSAVYNLYGVYNDYMSAIKNCANKVFKTTDIFEAGLKCPDKTKLDECFSDAAKDEPMFAKCVGKNFTSVMSCLEHLKGLWMSGLLQGDVQVSGACTFKPFDAKAKPGSVVECAEGQEGCVSLAEINKYIEKLKFLSDIEILKGEKSNMGKSIGIGTAAGAGAGGLATAITALVEHGNINCRVGDGLAQVGLGKSHSIGTLKDFYVKWNLRLPEAVTLVPATVVDCKQWKDACASFKDMNQCATAQVTYKPSGASTPWLVRSACAVYAGQCVENHPVAVSYGACE